MSVKIWPLNSPVCRKNNNIKNQKQKYKHKDKKTKMRTTLFFPAALVVIMNLAMNTNAVSIAPSNKLQQATELAQTGVAANAFLDTVTMAQDPIGLPKTLNDIKKMLSHGSTKKGTPELR